MPYPIPEEQMALLTEAILQGRKIEAIKLHRKLTGLGLKESKDAIEEMEASLRAKFPDRFAALPQTKGCLGAAAVLCLGVGIGTYWLTRL